MQNLTIINQQYTPEVASTGQIFQTMAEYLYAHNWQVTVLTGTPYYPGLTSKPPRREMMNGVSVHRLWNTTFPKKSILGKLMNLLSFQISLLFYCLFAIPKDEIVLVATAPPMAVLSAVAGKWLRGYRVLMTVQDLYPDALAASGMKKKNSFSYRLLASLMGRSMRACDRVVTISRDMSEHLGRAYGLAHVAVIPNLFPEHIQPVSSAEAKAARDWTDRFVVQYSGNFGVAHEYKTLLGVARFLKGESGFLFHIAGAGRNYDAMREECEAEGLENVFFEGYAPREALERHLGTADVSVVIMDAAFQTVLLPSKYYGILASGRGVLLISGCDSDILRDIREQNVGLAFDHGQSEEIAKALIHLRRSPEDLRAMGTRARALYDEKYSQAMILDAYNRLMREV